jgi:hypothetical protein
MAHQPPILLSLPPPRELDQEKARRKFAEFWKEPVICPVCKTDDWTFGEQLVHLFHLSELESDTIWTITAIPVFCTTCGYIMQFNAKKLGLEDG